MDYLIFVPIIAFLGLVAGILLTKTIIEERIPGRKYYRWMKRILLFMMIIGLLYYNTNYSALFFGIILGTLIMIFAEEYVIMGVSLVTAFLFSKEIIFLTAVLIFLYGLPYGTLHGKRKIKEFLAKNLIYFFAPFLALYFFKEAFLINTTMKMFMIGVSSGGLFNLLIRRQ